MDDATLRRRLWDGFAALQTLLGGHARHGSVVRREGLVASVVPSAPDSPALNAVVALEPAAAPYALDELAHQYAQAGVRRWAIWVDGGAWDVTAELRRAGLGITSASPGMGAESERLQLDLAAADPPPPGPHPRRGPAHGRAGHRPGLGKRRRPAGAHADLAAGGHAARLPGEPQ